MNWRAADLKKKPFKFRLNNGKCAAESMLRYNVKYELK